MNDFLEVYFLFAGASEGDDQVGSTRYAKTYFDCVKRIRRAALRRSLHAKEWESPGGLADEAPVYDSEALDFVPGFSSTRFGELAGFVRRIAVESPFGPG